MTLRSMPDTIDSLRVLLEEVEQTTDATHAPADLAELRRLLIHRISELEIAQTRSQEGTTTQLRKKADYKLAS
jgi:hypothetical protein